MEIAALTVQCCGVFSNNWPAVTAQRVEVLQYLCLVKVQQSVHRLGVDPGREVVMSPGVLQHGRAWGDVAPGVQRRVRTVAQVVVRVNLQQSQSSSHHDREGGREVDRRTNINYLSVHSGLFTREKKTIEKKLRGRISLQYFTELSWFLLVVVGGGKGFINNLILITKLRTYLEKAEQ